MLETLWKWQLHLIKFFLKIFFKSCKSATNYFICYFFLIVAWRFVLTPIFTYQVSHLFFDLPVFLFFKILALTLFFPMFPFDPPENIRKPKVFWCFQGDQKRTLGRKRLVFSFPSFFRLCFFTLLKCETLDISGYSNYAKVFIVRFISKRTKSNSYSIFFVFLFLSHCYDLYHHFLHTLLQV